VNTKTLHGLKVTDAAEGKISAVIATLNVIDKDRDVTLPGAFQRQEVRLSTWNHGSWQSALPIGKGVISEKGDEAIFDGHFFMGMESARDTFEALKGLGGLAEFSYGYDIVSAEPGTHDGESVQFLKRVKVHEVSPVILGAGENTRTLAMKAKKDQLEPWQKRALVLKTRLSIERADALDGAAQYQHAVDLITAPQQKAAALLEERMKAYELRRLGK
jgi:hypothetical protein